jgi:hypothetical protein
MDTVLPWFHIKRWLPSVPGAGFDSCAWYPYLIEVQFFSGITSALDFGP